MAGGVGFGGELSENPPFGNRARGARMNSGIKKGVDTDEDCARAGNFSESVSSVGNLCHPCPVLRRRSSSAVARKTRMNTDKKRDDTDGEKIDLRSIHPNPCHPWSSVSSPSKPSRIGAVEAPEREHG